jgi:acyl-coenzyme A synthetase/AMP-(fatty) acid ligase
MNAVEHLLGAEALARHGERAALICGARTLSYRALAAQVARAANALRAFGVRPGERVLLQTGDTPEFAAAWLGTLHAGAVAVALNRDLPAPELDYIRADSGARLTISDDTVGGAGMASGSWRAALERASAEATPVPRAAEDPAFWLYSSGTTGSPKGIIHAHRSVLAAGQAQRGVIGLAAGERTLTTSKLFFAYALEHGLLGPLAIGATALLEPDWPSAESVAALVERHRPATLFSVPTFYRRLLSLAPERLAPFRQVRRFIAAGERLPAPLVAQWRAATGGEILSLYGMSETFCACIVTPPGTSTGAHTGLPVAGVDTRLMTPEGDAARPGEAGVLWLRHPALALGYANRAEQTTAQFRDFWFCSQDLFVRDAEGFYAYQGRSDELVKVAGQWVQPSELEEAVADEAAIAEAACVPVTDRDGFERLALFVAHRGDAEAARAAAARACEEKLPRHKRPKWIHAVTELPRTATGKVQRFKLREQLEK